MQSLSCSSFYMKMRQTYAPVASQRRPELMRASPPLTREAGINSMEIFGSPLEMMTPSPSFRGPSAEGHSSAGAIAEIQRKLTAIQRKNGKPQYQHQNDRKEEQQQKQQKQQQDASYSNALFDPEKGGNPIKGISTALEQEVDSLSPVLSSPSSRFSNENDFSKKQPSMPLSPPVPGHKGTGEDEMLTPQEMAFLRVVEFAVPVSVHAQLEPGATLVKLCDKVTVKLFPSHLVLIRPDGVAAVELVIEELCELNEDEGACALDCIVQARGTTRRRLIRVICTDAIARGALFKLLCARRTQLEDSGRLGERTCGSVGRS
ncbi:hypothetical protein TcYC6_0067850 [Trypanosoma cruzi]|uniref:Uncharacterized protein n=1 Tax=Trypanosoma cruzi TaxID=5693 RepID=A0A7J6YFH8_TRYCR|nr:hypothetical protein ECC02_001220 [Trypanosoma cruzi]KAF8298367.1 hypothetical protein TcYC6_0067850 [Trypanosoma cruzi]RNC62186.1 putative antigenic protein [Trypanosoma cruzi]